MMSNLTVPVTPDIGRHFLRAVFGYKAAMKPIVEEYIVESEDQDGEEYWDQFADLDQLHRDFRLAWAAIKDLDLDAIEKPELKKEVVFRDDLSVRQSCWVCAKRPEHARGMGVIDMTFITREPYTSMILCKEHALFLLYSLAEVLGKEVQ
jgi:hypothetical protein